MATVKSKTDKKSKFVITSKDEHAASLRAAAKRTPEAVKGSPAGEDSPTFALGDYDVFAAAGSTARRIAEGRPIDKREAVVAVAGLAVVNAAVAIALGWIPILGPLLTAIAGAAISIAINAALIKIRGVA